MKTTIEEKPPAYDTNEVAARLNVNQATVHELLWEGKLKGFKIRRQWRIEREEVDRFIREQMVTYEPSAKSH